MPVDTQQFSFGVRGKNIMFFLFLLGDIILPCLLFISLWDLYWETHRLPIVAGWLVAPMGVCMLLLVSFYGMCAKKIFAEKHVRYWNILSMYVPFILAYFSTQPFFEIFFFYALLEIIALAASFAVMLLCFPFFISKAEKQWAREDYRSSRVIIFIFGGICALWSLSLIGVAIYTFFDQQHNIVYLLVLFLAYLIKIFPLIQRRIYAGQRYFQEYYGGVSVGEKKSVF